MRQTRSILMCFCFIVIALANIAAQASDYTFVKIANFGADELALSAFSGNAGINNHGDVIFTVQLASGFEATYIGNGSSLSKIIDTTGSMESIFYYSRFNDSRQFAYRAVMDDGSQALFRHSPSGEELVRTTISGKISSIPSINSIGEVAYLAREDAVSPSYLYRWNGSEKLILDTSGAYSDLGGWPSIADNGDIAVIVQLNGGGNNLIVANNNSTEVILDGSGNFEGAAIPAMSNNGAIAFMGHLNSNNTAAIGRYLENQEELIFGDDPAHLYVSNFPGINDSSDVAFMGAIDNITQAFVYDETLSTVLTVGDELDGRIVKGIGLQGDGCINNEGHLAFTISFDDGSWGVYSAVPEPCTILLLAAGGLILRRKRKM